MDNLTITEWNGFECEEFDFDGFPAKVIKPLKKTKNPPLVIKTEYFGAFPETEIALLNEGFYLAFIKNKNRWGTDEDLKRKADFIKFVCEKYGLSGKCVPVGMSCGGIFAIKLAVKYPKLVSCIYIDAPVINYFSCPCGFGKSESFNPDHREILDALSLTLPQLLAYRDMPLDNLEKLSKNKIPVIMVAGDSDGIVPYDENGIFVENLYKDKEYFKVFIKKGCDHHPHGLEDVTPVVEFIKKYSL